MKFPQAADGVADGVAIRSSLILINHTSRQASGAIHFYDNDGAPMSLNTTMGRGDWFEFSLGIKEVLRLETDAEGPEVGLGGVL